MTSKKCLPDDEKFNISFVQTVEKYECLYDHTLKSYSNRSEQDKAWNQVAGVYFSTASECKKKWKTLRGSFTRYLKQRTGKSGDSAKSKKKYYLWDVMQFILPFTKSRPQSSNLPIEINEDEIYDTDQCSIDDDENTSRATDIEEHPPDHHPEADLLDTRTPSRTSSRSSTKRKAPPKPLEDEMENAVINYLSKKTAPQPENPDLDFFKSLLPDVGTLNASEKRRFKVIVLQTLDNMLQERKTSRSASTSMSNTDGQADSLMYSSNVLPSNSSASASTSSYNNDRPASENLMYSSDVLPSNTSHTYHNIYAGNFTPSYLVNAGNYLNYQPGSGANTSSQKEPSLNQ